MSEKRFIVSICRVFHDVGCEPRHIPYMYSVMAESPRAAAKAVFADHKNVNLHMDAYGEVLVLEAKAGRLDDYNHFYAVKDLISPEMVQHRNEKG